MKFINRIALTVLAASGLFLISPAVRAQAGNTPSIEERTLQAQITALAQAGDTGGIQALVRAKIAQGKAAMVASVAKSMASTGVSLASSDSSSSAALIKAAVLIAGDSAVSAADNTVANAVGASAAQAVAILQTIDPGAAATVQTAIAISGSESIQVAYNNGGSQTNSQQTGQTQAVQTQVRQTQTTQTTQTVVVVEPTPEPQQRSATITLSYGTFVVSWFDGATTVTLARTGVGSATGFEVTVNTLNGMTSAARQDLQSKLEALLSPVVITVGTGDIITVSPSS